MGGGPEGEGREGGMAEEALIRAARLAKPSFTSLSSACIFFT